MAQLIKIGKTYYSDLRMGGKRIRRALSRYPKVAQDMLDDLVAERRALKHGYTPQNMSWNMFKMRYKDHCIKKKRDHKTIYRSELSFRMLENEKHIVSLSQVTPDVIEDVMLRWEKAGKTSSVITRAVRAIKAAMRVAENKGYIDLQNWRKVEVADYPSRIDYFDFKPYEELLNKVRKGWIFTDCLLQGREGLRSGEVYHLEFSDIQFDRNLISFTSKPHLNWKIKGDKKGIKKRIIPLDAGVKAYLKSIARPHGFVLGPDRPKNIALFYKLLQNAIKDTGVLTHHGKLGTPHTLRHTFASHLISNGVTLEELKDLLGHEFVKTTEIYSHLMPHAAVNAIKKLPNLCSAFVPVLTHS